MFEADLVHQPPAEVQVLDARSRALYERIADHKIVDQQTYRVMAEIMRQVKELANVIEARFEPHIKRAYETHKGLCNDKKRALECLLDAEKLAKEKIGHYYIEAEAAGQVPQAEGLSVMDEWTGEVVDVAKIPKKFLIPDLDKLKEHTKLYKEATRIPGWKVIKKKRVAQRV